MMYTILYYNDKHERVWKKADSLEIADDFGQSNSPGEYDISVSLYEYDRLKKEIETLKKTLKDVANFCKRAGGD